MPKIFGTNILGILAASIALYLIGFAWYSALFGQQWQALTGITEEMGHANMEKLGPMFFVYGLLITLGQVLGLAYILQHASAARLVTCVKICVIIAALIALPIIAYDSLYGFVPLKLLYIDIGHLLVGYSIVGMILSFFRGKDTRAN